METLSSIALIGILITAILLTIGLIRPGFVVWWNQSNSRKNVLAVWGSMFMVFVIFYFIVSSQRSDGFKDQDAQTESHDIESHK